MKKWHLSFFAISIVFCSCVLFSRFQPGAAEFEKLKEATSTEEAREQFNRYPVGTQIDIYLFGLKYIEPDDNSTQKFLVDDGEKKVSTIIERIRDTNEEFDKAYLMETVSLIEKDCDCVTEDQKAMLFQIGSSLKDRYHRRRFQQAFEQLNKTER
jgi:hypothetical protein